MKKRMDGKHKFYRSLSSYNGSLQILTILLEIQGKNRNTLIYDINRNYFLNLIYSRLYNPSYINYCFPNVGLREQWNSMYSGQFQGSDLMCIIRGLLKASRILLFHKLFFSIFQLFGTCYWVICQDAEFSLLILTDWQWYYFL